MVLKSMPTVVAVLGCSGFAHFFGKEEKCGMSWKSRMHADI